MAEGLLRAKECREERKRIAEDMKKLLEAAQARDDKSLTPEELEQFDRWEEAVTKLEREFTVLEKAAATLAAADAKDENNDVQRWASSKVDDLPTPEDYDLDFRGWLTYDTPYYREEYATAGKKIRATQSKATRSFEMPKIGMIYDPKTIKIRTPQTIRELRQFAQGVITTRATAAQTITTTGGGNLRPNDNTFMNTIQETLLAGGAMGTVATVIQTADGNALPIPGHAGNDKGGIVAINTAVVTQDTSFTQQSLNSFKFTSNMIKLPGELVTDSQIDIQGFVARKVGDRIMRYQEEMWATGAASLTEPEGIVTSGSSGGAAAGSVAQSSEGNITYTDLVQLVHDIDPAYRGDSQFLAHDSVLLNVRKQVDGDGRPLWQPSLTSDKPDMLVGYPVVTSQEHNAFTGTSANATKVLTFGRHSDYWIRHVGSTDVRVLRERFGELDQIAVLGFERADGEYINPNAGSSLSSIKYLTFTSS